MKIKKCLLSVLVSTIILAVFATTASAYNLTGYKWSTRMIPYYVDTNSSSRAKEAFQDAIAEWNSLTRAWFYNNSANQVVYCCDVYRPDAKWDGVTTVKVSTNPRGFYDSATVMLNSAATDTWENMNALKSVAVHELGHVLGLSDNGRTQTIMNQYTWGDKSRYGYYGLTGLTWDDMHGVNSLYK